MGVDVSGPPANAHPPGWDFLGEADWTNIQAKLLPGFTHIKWRYVSHRQPGGALSPVLHHGLLPLAVWVLRIRKQRSREDVVTGVEEEMEVKLVIEIEVVGRHSDGGSSEGISRRYWEGAGEVKVEVENMDKVRRWSWRWM